jgi:hypothetical protein
MLGYPMYLDESMVSGGSGLRHDSYVEDGKLYKVIQYISTNTRLDGAQFQMTFDGGIYRSSDRTFSDDKLVMAGGLDLIFTADYTPSPFIETKIGEEVTWKTTTLVLDRIMLSGISIGFDFTPPVDSEIDYEQLDCYNMGNVIFDSFYLKINGELEKLFWEYGEVGTGYCYGGMGGAGRFIDEYGNAELIGTYVLTVDGSFHRDIDITAIEAVVINGTEFVIKTA